MIAIPSLASLISFYSDDSGVTQSSGAVSAWNDRVGTNNLTGTSSPYYVQGAGVRMPQTTLGAYLTSGNFTLDKRNFGIFFVMRTFGQQSNAVLMDFNGVVNLQLDRGGSANGELKTSPGTYTGLVPTYSWSLIVITGNASNLKVYCNSTTPANLTALTAGSSTGPIRLGKTNSGSFSSFFDCRAWGVCNAEITASDVSTLMTWATSNSLCNFSPTQEIVFAGDSITQGVGSVGNQSYPDILNLDSSIRVWHYGTAGAEIGSDANDTGGTYGTLWNWASTCYDSHLGAKPATLVVCAGINEVLHSRVTNDAAGGDAIYARLVGFLAARRAAGWTGSNKIVLMTEPVLSAGYTTCMGQYFANIRANHASICDVFVDVAADPRLWYGSGISGLSNSGDNVHLNTLGNSVIAARLAQALQLQTDKSAVDSNKANISTASTILGVTGTMDMSLYTLISGVVSAQYVLTGHSNYSGGASGTLTLPTTSHVMSDQTYGVGGNGTTGTLTLPNVVNVLTGTSYGVGGNGSSGSLTLPAANKVDSTSGNYGVGGNGTTPTLNIAALEAAAAASQLSTDQAAVVSAASSVIRPADGGATILGQSGTFNLSSDRAIQYATGEAAQLSTDQASVNSAKANIRADATILGVTGTLSLDNIINTASGNYVTITPDKVKAGESFGVGLTGTMQGGSLDQATLDMLTEMADTVATNLNAKVGDIPTNPLLTNDARLVDAGKKMPSTEDLDAASDLVREIMKSTPVTYAEPGNTAQMLIDAAAGAGIAGTGDTAINHNTGGTDALRIMYNGNGVDNATIRCYLKTAYDAGTLLVLGTTYTASDGRWAAPLYQNAGFDYVLMIEKPGVFQAYKAEISL